MGEGTGNAVATLTVEVSTGTGVAIGGDASMDPGVGVPFQASLPDIAFPADGASRGAGVSTAMTSGSLERAVVIAARSDLREWFAGDAGIEDKQVLSVDMLSGMNEQQSLSPLTSRQANADPASQQDAGRDERVGLSLWALSEANLQMHLSSRDGDEVKGLAAIGYGVKSGLGVDPWTMQAAIGAPGFGRDAHSMQSFNGLQEGLVRLN